MKGHVISFIIGTFLFILGSVIGYFSILEYDFVDAYPPGVELKTEEGTYSLENTTYKLRIDTYSTVQVITDENLNDEFKIEVDYLEGLTDVKLTESNTSMTDKKLTVSYTTNNISKKLRLQKNILIDMLKEKEIYNFALIDPPVIRIYVSSENSSKVIISKHDFDIDYEDEYDLDF